MRDHCLPYHSRQRKLDIQIGIFVWPAFGDFPHYISKGIDDDDVGDEDEAERVKPILARPVFRVI